MKLKRFSFLVLVLSLFSGNMKAQFVTVKVDEPTAVIQPTMWGIFFEDINLAADGGLYAELFSLQAEGYR